MRPVTACVITFNEAAKIEGCLRSLAFCAELVVVDSHSTDETRALAEGLGARVVERDWPGHIDQKNAAVELASHPWVLCVDADERVTPELAAEIERALEDPQADGYSMPRRNVYLGRWIRGGGWYPDRKLRLFRKEAGRWGGVNPHDHVELAPGARSARLRGDLEHLSYDSIADHLKTIDYFSTIAAREKLARGARGARWRMLCDPPFKFFKMFVLQGGWRDGWRGVVVAMLGAFYVFLRFAKLYELCDVEGKELGGGEPVEYGRRGER